LFGRGHTEWSTDFLFKKPFTLSDKVEFMVGAGPQWSQPFKGDPGSFGAEFALDFMFWPTLDRKYGWFAKRLLMATDKAVAVARFNEVVQSKSFKAREPAAPGKSFKASSDYSFRSMQNRTVPKIKRDQPSRPITDSNA
jgi:hypothetical protein